MKKETKFVASDGTEFNDVFECFEHEMRTKKIYSRLDEIRDIINSSYKNTNININLSRTSYATESVCNGFLPMYISGEINGEQIEWKSIFIPQDKNLLEEIEDVVKDTYNTIETRSKDCLMGVVNDGYIGSDYVYDMLEELEGEEIVVMSKEYLDMHYTKKDE